MLAVLNQVVLLALQSQTPLSVRKSTELNIFPVKPLPVLMLAQRSQALWS